MWAAEQSEARIAKEDASQAKLATGALGLDLYGMRALLASLGVDYVESIDDL